MELTIRSAITNDYEAVARLLRQIAQLHHQWRPDVYRPAQKYDQMQYEAMLGNADAPILVAENAQGEVLGYVMLRVITPQNPVMQPRSFLWVDDLCVDQAARGQGIGEVLMHSAAELARARGLNKIELNVWECNEGAMRFYERLGYTAQKRGMEIAL